MYSFNTSLPAYKENKADKDSQAERILNFIVLAKYTTLKQLEEVTGLPQSTISGRVSDLIEGEKVRYDGQIVYSGRLRKKIIPVIKELRQSSLF
jgi:transcriptional antiterminator